MKAIQARLDAVSKTIGLTQLALKIAQKRARRLGEKSTKARETAAKYTKIAKQKRAKNNPDGAARFDRKANNKRTRGGALHVASQSQTERVKRLTRKLRGLEKTKTQLQAAAARTRKQSGCKINGNKVTGGNRRGRMACAMDARVANCASGKAPAFYSQIGRTDVTHGITGEAHGERSDCSSWATSVHWSAGLTDPNGGGYTGTIYTGTIVEHCQQIPESELKVGDFIVYGSGAGHHVEVYRGPGDLTVGHGSAPVDHGVVDLFGDGNYRCFRNPALG